MAVKIEVHNYLLISGDDDHHSIVLIVISVRTYFICKGLLECVCLTMFVL